MTEYIAKKMTIWLLKGQFIDKEDYELYYLGNEVIVSTGITSFIILLIGLMLKNLFGAIIFLICFISIRNFSGGYHAKTRWGCLLTTVVSYISSYYITELQMKYANSILTGLLIAEVLISGLIFLRYAPIENKNKKLLPDWRKKNRKWMLAVVIVWNILGIMILVTKANFATQIFNTILIISILVLRARRENYAEN